MNLSWFFFKNYLFSKKSNSLIRTISRFCIAGTAFGVASLIIILSVMEDFGRKLHRKILTLTPHLTLEKGVKPFNLKFLQEDQRIKELRLYVKQDVILRSEEGLLGGAIAKGYNTQSFKNFLNQFKEIDSSLGEVYSLDPGSFKEKDIFMSLDLVYSMGLVEGDQIFFILPESLLFPLGDFPQYEALNLKGVLSADSARMYLRHVFYNSDETLKLFKESDSREKGVEIFLEKPEHLEGLEKELGEKGIEFISWKEQYAELFFTLKMEKLALTVLLLFSLVIASFSILTLLIFLISQKKKDIGMLMVMGLSRKKTRQIFTQTGLWICSFGIFIGAFFGVFTAVFLKFYPLDVLPSRLYYDSFISAEVPWGFLILVIFFSLILAWIGSKVASQFYIRLSPAEILRSEKAFL